MTLVSGRKYGIGKYGAKTYDLGVIHTLPPWVPIPELPSEIWVPIVDVPPWCEQPPVLNGAEIWSPVVISAPVWSEPSISSVERWIPVPMPVSSNG